jgi:biopolymer transport protein ExbD
VKIVQVLESGALMVNGVGVDMAQLEAQLDAARARDPKFSVMIRGEARAPYNGVIQVVDLVSRMGIESVGLITSKIGT